MVNELLLIATTLINPQPVMENETNMQLSGNNYEFTGKKRGLQISDDKPIVIKLVGKKRGTKISNSEILDVEIAGKKRGNRI